MPSEFECEQLVKKRLETHQTVMGSWKIDRSIGSGSYGCVFHIVKDGLGTTRSSALKVIPVERGEGRRARGSSLEKQAQRLAEELNIQYQIGNHQNLVAWQDQDILYSDYEGKNYADILLRMEYLPDSLASVLETRTMSPVEVVKTLKDCLQGLAFLHEKHFIHRDLKPENIFLTAEGIAKIGDFGVARKVTKTTGAKTFAGTMDYMAPEVKRNPESGYDFRADLYSLGLIAYELLERQLPAEIDDMEAELLPENLLYQTTVPDSLKQMIAKALAVATEDRFKDANEMLLALTRIDLKEPEKAPEIIKKTVKTESVKQPPLKKKAGTYNGFDDLASVQEPAKKRVQKKTYDGFGDLDKLGNTSDEITDIDDSTDGLNNLSTVDVEVTSGTLQITSTPDFAKWYIDDIYKGITPDKVELDPGRYNIRCKARKCQVNETIVEIKAGELKKLDIRLTENKSLKTSEPDKSEETTSKKGGYGYYLAIALSMVFVVGYWVWSSQKSSQFGLTVNTTPYNATVKILNITPQYYDGIKLTPGDYKIQVTKSGYEKVNKIVWISDASKTISISLKKAPTGDSSYETVHVPGGCFQMGSTKNDREKPIHKVCLDDFRMGKYEVTIGQYMKFVNATGGSHPEWLESGSKYNIKTGSDDYYKKRGASLSNTSYPIMGVSWNNARDYAKWLSLKTGQSYSLPTEAEWEYACRSGGKNQKYCGGSNIDSLAWYSGNSGKKTHAVGGKKGNGLGIYDMSGNVWEWTQDWFGKYSSGTQNNPKGASSGSRRVGRGGSWLNDASYSRSALRHDNSPDYRNNNIGFRLRRTSN